MLTEPNLEAAVVDANRRRDPIAYMDALNALRIRKLGPQLEYCFRNEYYGAKMREAGIDDPRAIDNIDTFRSLPALLTKAWHRESQEQSRERYGHPFGMHLCAPIEKVIHVAGTSGTTGLPTFYLFTKKDLDLTYTTIGRLLKMAGVHPGDSILQLFGLSIWVAGTTMLQASEAYGARPIPLGAEAGVTKALQYIDLVKPRVVFATPSMMSHLIDRAPGQLKRPLNACGIEIAILAGEPGLAIPAYRKRIQDGVGARVIDMTCGAWTNAAADCGGRDHNGLHYLAEDTCFRYDLVDPNTRKPLPLVDGMVGEAVHTALDYEAAPALRYATGDMLRLAVGECPNCGMFGARFNFVGRADDLMNVQGVKVFPTAVKEVVESFSPEVAGPMQVVLEEMPPRVAPPVRLRVEAGRGVEDSTWPALAERIESRVHASLKIRTQVHIVATGSLTVSNMKTKLLVIEPR
jgi:phenylacetate-CoA ligase